MSHDFTVKKDCTYSFPRHSFGVCTFVIVATLSVFRVQATIEATS